MGFYAGWGYMRGNRVCHTTLNFSRIQSHIVLQECRFCLPDTDYTSCKLCGDREGILSQMYIFFSLVLFIVYCTALLGSNAVGLSRRYLHHLLFYVSLYSISTLSSLDSFVACKYARFTRKGFSYTWWDLIHVCCIVV